MPKESLDTQKYINIDELHQKRSELDRQIEDASKYNTILQLQHNLASVKLPDQYETAVAYIRKTAIDLGVLVEKVRGSGARAGDMERERQPLRPLMKVLSENPSKFLSVQELIEHRILNTYMSRYNVSAAQMNAYLKDFASRGKIKESNGKYRFAEIKRR